MPSYLIGSGTSDMYPRRYRNMINQQKFTDAALKIQIWFKKIKYNSNKL